ncbi:MAG: hydroxyacid dehydrogenase [Candidatus Bathyarchaeia archaeon]
MSARILVCDPIDEEGIRRLMEADFEVDVKLAVSSEELKEIVSDYDALIVRSRTKVTKEIIERGKRLKVIGRAGTGLDNIDVRSAEERGIIVLNTPEAAATAVAELTIGLILSLARNIPLADRSMKEGRWIKKDLRGWQLEGKTLGLIGLGNIGLRVAVIAKCLEMKILVTKRTPPSKELLNRLGARFVPLDDLLKESDIVSLHLPLSEETHRMIGSRELNLMKDGAYLINTSRGAIVDEEALLEALESGKLGGAALDVYGFEPPTDLRLVRLPNVVCTPHIGAQTEEAQREASIMIAGKIIDLLAEQ